MSALLATAAVVNLGDLPTWSYFSTTLTSHAIAAGGPTDTVSGALLQLATVEQQALPMPAVAEVVPASVEPVTYTSRGKF